MGRQLGTSYPDYTWTPEVLTRVHNSTETIADMVMECPKEEREGYVRNVIFPILMGVEDFVDEDVAYMADPARRRSEVQNYAGDMISRRAILGWTTHGHTGIDVNLYGYAGTNYPHIINSIRGNRENTELGQFVEDYLGLNHGSMMTSLTHRLEEGIQDGSLVMYPPGGSPIPAVAFVEGEMEEDQLDASYHHPHGMTDH